MHRAGDLQARWGQTRQTVNQLLTDNGSTVAEAGV
jgi:hypothetical protein